MFVFLFIAITVTLLLNPAGNTIPPSPSLHVHLSAGEAPEQRAALLDELHAISGEQFLLTEGPFPPEGAHPHLTITLRPDPQPGAVLLEITPRLRPVRLRLPDDEQPTAHSLVLRTVDISPYSELLAGLVYYTLDQYEQALRALSGPDTGDLLASDDHNAALLAYLLADCALALGDDAAALAFYAQADDSALHTAALLNMAWLHTRQGHPEQGLALLEGLYDGPAGDALQSQLYALSFRYDDALDAVNRAIASRPFSSLLYLLRGEVWLLLYEWDRARRDFDLAIALDPHSAGAYFRRGVLFYTLLLPQAALDDFLQYLALAPDGPHAQQVRAYVADLLQTAVP